jgi:hypothetical protein
MQADAHGDDIRAIEAIIARQFASLCWGPDAAADWTSFAADFFPGATLYPAARPTQGQTVEAFIQRMKGLAETTLQSFHEVVLGTEVQVFGNVATATAACEITENNEQKNAGIEMLLLVKNEGVWQIVSQAWDTASPVKQIPSRLLGCPVPASGQAVVDQ